MKSYETWFGNAKNDLETAKELLLETNPALDIAVQYTQASAVKALKAFLTFQEQSVNDTNDLTELVELCAGLNPAFSALADPAEELTAYGIIFRDPEETGMVPEKKETAEAVRLAETILQFVTAKIY